MSTSTEKSDSAKAAETGLPKLAIVNEKRSLKDNSGGSVRPRYVPKDVPDVRHMEKALIGLLADFDSGKLRAFGKGCSMEQMTDIREQQEQLAKLHFDLGASLGPGNSPLSAEGLHHTQSAMSQLVQRLEQLSVSIEGLHTSNEK